MLYINEAKPPTNAINTLYYGEHMRAYCNTSHDLNTGFHNQEPIRYQTINQVITKHINPNTPQCASKPHSPDLNDTLLGAVLIAMATWPGG